MIMVFDREGSVFTMLRELDLGLPLWRVTDRTRLETVEHVELAIVADYRDVPWELLSGAEEPLATVVLTHRFDEDEALEAIGRGLIGYLDASGGHASLRTSIQHALDGEPAYGRKLLGRWLHEQTVCARAHCNAARLTDRQREVLRLIAEGFADKEIADRLGIATATAQKHVTNILERLGVANRAAAAAAVCQLVAFRPFRGTNAKTAH